MKSQSLSIISIGEQLRTARTCRGITIAMASHTLLIPEKYLRELEANRWHSIPETLYRELFLKSYATYLGLEWENVKSQYVAECRLFDEEARFERLHAAPSLRSISFVVAPNLMKTIALAAIISAGFAYLLFLGYRTTIPPVLAVLSPAQDMTVTTDHIVIIGTTLPTSHVTINGENVILSPNGSFEQSLILTEGMNIITVSAAKKYSKEYTIERRVLYRRETARDDHQRGDAF